jgi:hypothetical protein
MDHDRRLTRSYWSGRSFFPHLISVAEAAGAILRNYYRLESFRWKDPAEMRAWLIRNKYTSQAERAFDLLAGDQNEELQWLDGARILTTKVGSGFLGDELRGRTSPSVSDLLLKRVMQSRGWTDNLSLLLYQWDPPSSLPALRQQALLARHYQGQLYDSIIAALLNLGDSAFIGDWTASIANNPTPELERLVPIWTSPTNEVLLELQRKLFLGPQAPLSPGNSLATRKSSDGLVRSPLLISPVFRESVLDGLARTDAIGTVERLPNGNLDIRHLSVSALCVPGDGKWCRGFRQSRPPGTRNIRIGDWIAFELSWIDGFPEIDLEATEGERDESIGAMAQFLRSRAADLRAPPSISENTPWWNLSVSLAVR